MSFIRTLEAIEFIKPMPNSTTKALLVLCDDGREFVVKHGGSKEETGGRRVLVAEYLCYLMAKLFRLAIPEHCFIVIGRAFRQAVRHEEISGFLKSSPDLCVGSEYIRWTEPFRRDHAKMVANKLMLAAIFGFDQYVYNPDRMPENPNLLYDRMKRGVLMIDHSAAMWSSIDQVEELAATVLGADYHILCRDHAMHRNAIIPLVNELSDKVINSYIDSVPGLWFTQDFDGSFVGRFLKTRRDSILKILSGVQGCR